MKLPNRILAIAFLALAVLFIAASPPGKATAADRDNAAQAQQDIDTTAPTIVGVQVAIDVQQIEPWVRESIGLPPLNSRSVTFSPVKELEGYRTVVDKPKITTARTPEDAELSTNYRGFANTRAREKVQS